MNVSCVFYRKRVLCEYVLCEEDRHSERGRGEVRGETWQNFKRNARGEKTMHLWKI